MKFFRKLFSYKFLTILLLCLYTVIYFLKAKTYLDPDLGWGLKVGEFILKSGIPQKDPFSYTMPSYPFIDYSWLTHVIMFLLYANFGNIGLAIFFTVIAIFSLIIIIWKSESRLIPLQILFGATIIFFYFGIRSQVASWLFFAVVSRLVLDDGLWKKFRYFIPLLFLFWANLHGGFVAGLGILLIATLTRNLTKTDIFIVGASAGFTLINPYGIRLWRELGGSMTDISIRFSISEWQPLSYKSSILIYIFISFSLAFLYQFRNKYKLHMILPYIVLLFTAFSSTRNVPLFMIYALVLIKIAFQNFLREVGKNKKNLFRFRIMYTLFFAIVMILAIDQLKKNYLAAASGEKAYPQGAVSYLLKYPSRGQILSSYGWGGYLIWKLPQNKVFIDGRMPTWRQKDRDNESKNVYEDYNSLLMSKVSMPRIFGKYKIDTVLLPQQWFATKDSKTKKYIFKFVSKLKENSFREVYQDKVAIIFRKKSSTTEDN